MGGIHRTPNMIAVKSIAAATTLSPNDAGVILVANTGTMTITLPPAAVSRGVNYKFIKTTAAASAITLDGNASETINGATTSALMNAQWEATEIVCDGSAWYIVGTAA